MSLRCLAGQSVSAFVHEEVKNWPPETFVCLSLALNLQFIRLSTLAISARGRRLRHVVGGKKDMLSCHAFSGTTTTTTTAATTTTTL